MKTVQFWFYFKILFSFHTFITLTWLYIYMEISYTSVKFDKERNGVLVFPIFPR